MTLDTTSDVLRDPQENVLPPLRNPPILEATDDLTNLSYLNEPAILHAIRKRYSQLAIYTYSGIVLIATNPFQRVDSIYSQDVIQAYAGKRKGELEPHIFAIAEDAYRCMLRDNANQTIVVSGESGAGKTVSAKLIMRYFATVEDPSKPGKRRTKGESMSRTEEQILATNPIMEAFGNAKTTRNDNSSRFGKYIEIMFDQRADIVGARLRTYLLERSRLVFQPATERNYHIFYQLCAGASNLEREQFDLPPVMDYFFLNQGGDPRVENTDDAREFDLTREALTTVGIPPSTQHNIFRILAALLHLGNCKIESANDKAVLSSREKSCAKACELLGVDAGQLAKWTIKKQIVTRNEKITTDLTQKQAVSVRDSIAKYIYSSVFEWLVLCINRSLATEEVFERVKSFIGVLDIYGFEHFQKNSFEQFCINYANEKLQQEFNQHVFKLEQEEYLREEINWKMIDYSDNQPCIDLIESKLGILPLLDEESRLPSGSDESWTNKLYQHFATPKYEGFFKKPRFGKSAFTVCHYAMDVSYDTDGFIEKNRDAVPDEQVVVIQATANSLLKEICAMNLGAIKTAEVPVNGKRGTVITRKPTLGNIFKLSLIELMTTINSTNVHYIRCIKPNERKSAWHFDPPMVLNQLRACGVLETIRISCAGFPTRWTYDEFVGRYYMLLRSSQWSPETRKIALAILEKTLDDEDKFQMGKTKIFFRAGMLAFLEKLRAVRLDECAILIQKNLRAIFYRKRYLAVMKSIHDVQRVARGFMARRRAVMMIEDKAATTIKRVWKGQRARKEFLKKRRLALMLQAACKAFLARRLLLRLKREKSAITIQRSWRMYQSRRLIRVQRNKIIKIQGLVRVRLAKKELKRLKTEAKSVTHYKEVSYKLENKVVELTQSLAKKRKDNKLLTQQLEALQHKFAAWDRKNEAGEARIKELKAGSNKASEAITRVAFLEDQILGLREQFSNSASAFDHLEQESELLRQDLSNKSRELTGALETKAGAEASSTKLSEEVAMLRAELLRLSVNGVETPNGNKKGLLTLRSNPGLTNAKRKSYNGAVMGSPGEMNGSVYSPRPVSMFVTPSKESRQSNGNFVILGGVEEVEQEVCFPTPQTNAQVLDVLRNDDRINEEIAMGIVQNLKIPIAKRNAILQEKEVLFPAHLVNLLAAEMWKYSFVKESERMLATVMHSIQQNVTRYEGKGEEIINPGAFWLSNVHEMLCFAFTAENEMLQGTELDESQWQEYDRLVSVLKHDLESLEYNIYHSWIIELKKILYPMIIPAVLESQDLPGFVTNEGTMIFGRMLGGKSDPKFGMHQLLDILDKVHQAMKVYYLEPAIMTQVVNELLKLVGVTAFNDLLMRRNFLSWKRGLQINYNITRIEEWCQSHEMPEGTIQLEHLMQATKLMQVKKGTLADIEIIYDICWMLTPSQISKLINQYHALDYEQPMNPDILKAVAAKVIADKNDVMLLDAVAVDDSGPYDVAQPRGITELETFVPSWVQAPTLKRFAELVSTQSLHIQEAEANGTE